MEIQTSAVPYIIPRYGLLWCPVIKVEQILGAQATNSNISRVMDQVYALNCTVGSNPQLRPVHCQEVHSGPLEVCSGLHF